MDVCSWTEKGCVWTTQSSWDMQIDEMDICSWTDQHFETCFATHPGCSMSPSSIHNLITHPELQTESHRRTWTGKCSKQSWRILSNSP
ncbi:hypothetical protein Q8A67_012811 [Cirrhinus molitorella]|uniref:Uncharacterized protein n=1 Tax=Cirrhinus molitorella TaxID=172907 RepID=A0AA88PRK4_9TELE|nr:hypothetical protein Q8A67_012811 [Cirrhinus molitorella]